MTRGRTPHDGPETGPPDTDARTAAPAGEGAKTKAREAAGKKNGADAKPSAKKTSKAAAKTEKSGAKAKEAKSVAGTAKPARARRAGTRHKDEEARAQAPATEEGAYPPSAEAYAWPPGYDPRPSQRAMHEGMQARRFSVVVAHRRMGKTVAVLNHLIRAAATCERPRPFYAYLAPFTHQAKAVAWGYLKDFTAHIEDRRVRETELAVELPSGAKIRLFGADNPDALRGLYFDGVVLDEFAMMKPEAWLSVIRPALSDRGGFAVFIGTPAGHNAFHDVYRAALADTSWYAAMFTAETTGVLPEGELECAKRQMSEARFRQEYLCDFEASCEDTLIPLTLLNSSLGRRVSCQGLPLVMGVDVGLSLGGDPTAIVARRGPRIVHLEEFRLDETLAVAGRVRETVAQLSPSVICVDAIGWGAGVAHTLAGWGLPVQCVNVAESPAEKGRFERLRDELWWRAREFFSGRTAAIAPELELAGKLISELSSPAYAYTPEGRIKIESKFELKRRGQASPNLADAFVLTMGLDPIPQAGPIPVVNQPPTRSRLV